MIQPTSAPVSFLSKQQFDSSTLQLDRFDAIAKATLGGVTSSVDYALYAAQPALGWEYPREGLTGSASYKFLDRWSVDGSLVVDMSRHYYDIPGEDTPIFYPVGYSVGLGYKDECTTLTVRYSLEHQRPGGFSGICGRSGDLCAGDAQPDADVPARSAYAGRPAGERRPVTATLCSRSF